jgi:hypothetical protein
MSLVGDILSVTKDLEGRAKDRRDIDELRQIQSLALTLQTHNADIVDRDIKLMQEIAAVKAENLKLKEDLAKANAEDIRIAGGAEFHRGLRTGGQWLPFCPKCKTPATTPGSDYYYGCSDSNCGWVSTLTESDMRDIVRSFG